MKAQGMPLNTIILAVIALAVVVIIIMFTSGGFEGVEEDLSSCGITTSTCYSSGYDCRNDGGKVVTGSCTTSREVPNCDPGEEPCNIFIDVEYQGVCCLK